MWALLKWLFIFYFTNNYIYTDTFFLIFFLKEKESEVGFIFGQLFLEHFFVHDVVQQDIGKFINFFFGGIGRDVNIGMGY